MSLVTLVSPYTDAIVVTPTAGNGITLHEDGDFALSSDREWYYSTDDVAYGAMVRVAPAEVASIRRDGADKSLYLRTRSGAAQLAVAFSAIPTVPAGAAAGGLFGAKTVVVSTAGSDAAGAASKYAAEFLTIQAAITAAAAGDSVLVRPGAYATTASIVPKTGVPIYFFPGAVVTLTGTPGLPMFYDNGAAVAMQIGGYGKFVGVDREQLVQLAAASSCRLECQEVSFPNAGSSQPLISGNFGGTKSFNILVHGPCVSGGPLLGNAAAPVDVLLAIIEARDGITASQILVDTGSTGATRVSIKAPAITGGTGDYSISIANGGTGRYEIDTDSLVGAVNMHADSAELHLRARSHLGNIPGGAALYALGGKTFASWDECRANATTTDGVIALNLTGTLHALSGRIIGPNVAGGAAAMFFADTASLVLYPGAVLVAGAAAAASIALAGAAATPTAIAMGAIAANKAVEAGVTVAVGSLLVDAAVA